VISGGDSKIVTSPLDSKETNGLVVQLQGGSGSSGGSNNGEVLEVKAVVTIRKKMKSNIVEDQLEYFINGAGQGIQLQLVSEQIDPGLFHFHPYIIIISIIKSKIKIFHKS
jgi:lipoxygenase